MQEIQVQFLGQEDSLEKEMASHSSTLAWRIPSTEDPGRLQSMGHKELDTTEPKHFHLIATSAKWLQSEGTLEMFPFGELTASRRVGLEAEQR